MIRPGISFPEQEPPVVLPADTLGIAETALHGAGVEGAEGWRNRLRGLGAVLGFGAEKRDASPEARAASLVARAERVLVSHRGLAPLSERTSMSCGHVTDVFRYYTDVDSAQSGYAAKAETFQLADIHAAAQGLAPSDPKLYATVGGGRFAGPFRHAMNILTVGEGKAAKKFLVDLSFGQFVAQGGKPQISFRNGGIASTLLERGFVSLTKKNLQEYLSITTDLKDSKYIKQVGIDLLSRVTPLGYDGKRDFDPSWGLPSEGG